MRWRKPASPQPAGNPVPAAVPYGPTGYRPIPVIPPYQQNGLFAYPPLTMQGGNWPGVQKKNPIAGITHLYFPTQPGSGTIPPQTTQYKTTGIGTLKQGGAPGAPFGPGQWSKMYGNQMRGANQRAEAIIDGQLGW